MRARYVDYKFSVIVNVFRVRVCIDVRLCIVGNIWPE